MQKEVARCPTNWTFNDLSRKSNQCMRECFFRLIKLKRIQVSGVLILVAVAFFVNNYIYVLIKLFWLLSLNKLKRNLC